MMKKPTDGGKPRQLKGVTITAKRTTKPAAKAPYKASSVVQGKQIPSSRIDSARKANPALNRALGTNNKGSGGMDTYRDSKADLINSALKRKKA
jgi:hypothetical protein